MHTKERLGQAIRDAMTLKGVKQREVAEEFGVKQPSVSEWLRFGRLDKAHITHLVEYFGDVVGPEHWGLPANWTTANVELAQKLTPHSLTKAPQPGELLPLEVPRTRGEGRPVGSVVIAATGIRASMGLGADRPETDGAVSEMVVDEGWLRRNCTFTSPENLSLISGVGDSMRPTFEDGDALLVDLGIREVRVDAVYCLALNDELYVKRLQRRPDGTVVMISDNRAYDSYQIQPKRDRLDVLGRVVMTWNARRL